MEKVSTYSYAVTVKTVSDFGKGERRNVTLWFDSRAGDISLLGNLEHGTRIVVDQELVDDLQALLNIEQEEHGQGQKAE